MKLREKIKMHDIQPENLWNFDETDIRIGCSTKEEVVIPVDILEVYTKSPKDRKLITVIKTISAADSVIPPILIIQVYMIIFIIIFILICLF